MKLGISSYSYGWSIGVPENMPVNPLNEMDLLNKAEKYGVKLLQVGDNLPLHTLSEERLTSFKWKSKQLGIEIEIGTRGFKPEIIQTYIEIAKKLNSSLIRIVPDMKNYEPSSDEIVSVAKQFTTELERNQITLGIENHDRFFVKELARIIERIGSSHVGICLDTVNSFGAAEGTESVVDTVGPLTVNLHIKDFQIQRFYHLMGFTCEGRPAGQGMLNVPWLLNKLESCSRNCNAILELWTPPEESLEKTIDKEEEWVRQSMQYLRQWIKN